MQSFLVLSIALMMSTISFSQSNFTTIKCKSETNQRLIKNCITNEIKAFVDTNYDIPSVLSYTKPGLNRIYTRFKVDQKGKIIDIQAKGSAMQLELEAIRTLQSFPNLIPIPKEVSKEQIFEDIFTLLITFNAEAPKIDLPQKRLTGND
ncbi:hypothetical protein [Aquimarina algiphila]|uniref:hypothetical protein n=1 Tax=Aquimarina algiphila TaxID=2047982 RepID=UPI00232DB1B8|nr:hypothetical protein [Aquimarina algiphila]